MTERIRIDYYSDILCIWAWISQPRLDQLHRQFGEQVSVRHRFVDVFGDARNKISRQWGGEEGFSSFHDHVARSAEPFEHIRIHPDIWHRVRPASSLPGHLLLKAVDQLAPDRTGEVARALREQFFNRGQDIADITTLLTIAEGQGLDRAALQDHLDDGTAAAALSADLRSAGERGIKGSPTFIFNEGRQQLYGNVGYRILAANIEELLRHPEQEASWC